MFLFRRLSEKDSNLDFITGSKAFDDINKNGNLKIYIQQDIIKSGDFITYILLKKENDTESKLLGLIRYKLVNLETFLEDLERSKTPKAIQDKFNQMLSEKQCEILSK